MTPASAAPPTKAQVAKKHKPAPSAPPPRAGGSSGLLSLEWTISATLRP
jgi:hypothetical protein